MDIPAPARAPMEEAMDLLDHMDSLAAEQKKGAYPVLLAIIRNIVQHPLETKYRAFKKSNKKIQAALCNQYGQVLGPVHQFLLGLGFTETLEGYECTTQLLEVHGSSVELLEAMIESLDEAPSEREASKVQPATTGFRARKADACDVQASELAETRAAQAKAYQQQGPPPAATPSGYPVAAANTASASTGSASQGPKDVKISEKSAFNFQRRCDIEKEEAKKAEALNSLRAAQKERFEKAKNTGTAYSGEAASQPPSIAPGGYEGSSWFSGWFGGGSSSSGGPNSGGGRNRPVDRPPGAPRMKTLNDLPKPPPRGGG